MGISREKLARIITFIRPSFYGLRPTRCADLMLIHWRGGYKFYTHEIFMCVFFDRNSNTWTCYKSIKIPSMTLFQLRDQYSRRHYAGNTLLAVSFEEKCLFVLSEKTTLQTRKWTRRYKLRSKSSPFIRQPWINTVFYLWISVRTRLLLLERFEYVYESGCLCRLASPRNSSSVLCC